MADSEQLPHGFDVLQDPETLRPLAHPTRQRIFIAAVHEPVSAKELAQRFEQPLARISYHVRTLADAGLLRVVRRTRRRGAMETHYRAIATLEVNDEVLERAGPEFRAIWWQSAVRYLTDDTLHEVAAGAAEFDGALLARAHFVATDEGRDRLRAELLDFYERLARLEEELWHEARESGAPVTELNLGLLFHPGEHRAGRNGSFIVTQTRPGESELDTIPPVTAERD